MLVTYEVVKAEANYRREQLAKLYPERTQRHSEISEERKPMKLTLRLLIARQA